MEEPNKVVDRVELLENYNPRTGKVEFVYIDSDRLFDTMFDHIGQNMEVRKMVTEKAWAGYNSKGFGLLVVDPYDAENDKLETDIDTLINQLEWWDHQRCQEEPLPEYLPNDPNHYSPEFARNIRIYCPPRDQMAIAMIFRESCPFTYGTTVNTLALWKPNMGLLLRNPRAVPLNPYKDENNIGTPISLNAKKCAALGCNRIKAKGYLVHCPCCGEVNSDNEKCPEHKVRIDHADNLELKKCSRCLKARYCSVECQRKDWKRHKKECRPPAKAPPPPPSGGGGTNTVVGDNNNGNYSSDHDDDKKKEEPTNKSIADDHVLLNLDQFMDTFRQHLVCPKCRGKLVTKFNHSTMGTTASNVEIACENDLCNFVTQIPATGVP